MTKTNDINKVVDNIIKININKKIQLNSFLVKEPAVFIFIDNKIKINNKVIDRVYKLDRDKFLNDTQVKNIIIEDGDTNLTQDGDKEIFEWNLQQTIKTFFLEGGNNLYLFSKGDNDSFDYKLPLDINFMVGINLYRNNNSTFFTQLYKSNGDREIIYIRGSIDDVSEESIYTFVLESSLKDITKETKEKSTYHYLAHPAAYLSNLTLNRQIKDYCYTVTKSIIPNLSQQIELDDNKQTWTKNYIINIGGRGIVLGGELLNNDNLVNTFVLWLLKKRLQEIVLNILINKPSRSTVSSILENELSNELNNLYALGGLEGFINQGIDKIINYNGKSYTVLSYGEFLEKGYKLHIVNILDSSEEDIKNHKMTPITIIINQQNQIRFIELTLEVN